MQSRGAFIGSGGGPCIALDVGPGAERDTLAPLVSGGVADSKWRGLIAAAKAPNGAAMGDASAAGGVPSSPYAQQRHMLQLGTFGHMGDAVAMSQPLSSPTYEESSSGSFAFFSSPYTHAPNGAAAAAAVAAAANVTNAVHLAQLGAAADDGVVSGASFGHLDGIMSGGGAGGGGFATAPAAFGVSAAAALMDAGASVETLYPSERLALARMAVAAQQQQQQQHQVQQQAHQAHQAHQQQQQQQRHQQMMMQSGPAAAGQSACDDAFALGGFSMDTRACGGLLAPAGLKAGVGAVAAGGGGAAGSQQVFIPKSSSLYIKNLPGDADKCFLYERFAPFGAIMSVKVLCDPDTKVCRGVGFVNFAVHDDAVRAMQALHGSKVGDKLMHVSLQTPRIRAVV